MNRERAKELLPIIEAFANGEEIQARRDKDSDWRTMHTETNFPDEFEYRIKPKPREFWAHDNFEDTLETDPDDLAGHASIDLSDVGDSSKHYWTKFREVLDEEM